MKKEQLYYCMELRARIEAKGITIYQASILMEHTRTFLHEVLKRGNPKLETLLKIEKFLAVEALHWDMKKVDTERVLAKPFLKKVKWKQ